MATLNWKVAVAGGAIVGLGVGGFVLNDQDTTDFRQIRDIDLQSARDSLASLSSPVRVTTPTTALPHAVPTDDSARTSSPVAPPRPTPAPVPAPAYDDSPSADSPVQPGRGGDHSASSFSAGSST